jgi:hypothetical protein
MLQEQVPDSTPKQTERWQMALENGSKSHHSLRTQTELGQLARLLSNPLDFPLSLSHFVNIPDVC